MSIKSHKLKFSLGRIGRTRELDQWKHIDQQDVNIWVEVQQLIAPYQYVHNGVNVTVEVNWPKVTKYFQKYQIANCAFQTALAEKRKGSGKLIPNIDSNLELIAIVRIDGKNEFSDYKWYPSFFLEKYIYDVFFILNMSIPGSCEFLNLKFKDESERFYLSAFNFELGYEDFLNNKKICISELPIKSVYNWYKELSLNVKQKSDLPIEKAIFSLLHICKSDMDVTSIIWIFHALEAIYGTRVGEGFTNLIDRMAMLLHWNDKEKKQAKSHLRELYDFRSAFVHGGFKVHHPMRNEVIDTRLNDDYFRIYDLAQIGFNLVVLSIQTLIKNGWFGIDVKETIYGITKISD
jgi:hypothetical protein